MPSTTRPTPSDPPSDPHEEEPVPEVEPALGAGHVVVVVGAATVLRHVDDSGF